MRKLNSRQKLFLRAMLEHGFYCALRAADYTRRHAYKILNDPKAEGYLMSLIKDTVDELQLSHSELIKKCLAIADDKTTDKRLRYQIYQDLAALVERTEDGESDRPPMLPGAVMRMLKPAREAIELEDK